MTTASDCGGNDCVQAVGYSYWRNINNHVGRDTMLIVLGLSSSRGGSGPTLFRVHKTTGAVENLGALFPAGSPQRAASGEGWYFSGSLETMLYRNEGSRLVRQDVLSGATEVVFDAASQFGGNRYIWQVHSSDDDRVHSATLRDGGTSEMLGCFVYNEDTARFRYFPKVGAFDECHVDKSGRWLMILDNVDGIHGEDDRIIDLDYDTEVLLRDEEGAAGHADTGYGYMVSEDNWGAQPGTVRVWKFGQPLVPGSSQGLVVYHTTDWNVDAGHIAHGNSLSGVAPEAQYTCSSTVNRLDLPRANEIVCYRLDGSRNVLVVAPVMTDLNATGGGDDYSKRPKGNLDISGRFFIWTANAGTNRLDAFLVEVPSQHLTGGATDTTPPAVTDVSATDVGPSFATVRWTTSEAADGRVEYGTTSSYGSSSAMDAAPVLDHAMALSALTPDTLYHFRVISKDAAGNAMTTGDNTFRSAPAGGGSPGGVVTWTQATNLAVDGGSLEKVGGYDGGDDARAISLQQFDGGDAFLEFVAGEIESTRFIGLDGAVSPAAYNQIDFAIRLAAWSAQYGLAEVRENGVWRADTPFLPDDTFRIAIEAGVVRYYRNGVPFHTSSAAPAFPLRAHATLLGIGGHIDDATFGSAPTAEAPPEVTRVRFFDRTRVDWDPAPGATRYHVYRGLISSLSTAYSGTCRDDLDPDYTDTTLVDTESPATQSCFFYLISAENEAGEGELGPSSSGTGTCSGGN